VQYVYCKNWHSGDAALQGRRSGRCAKDGEFGAGIPEGIDPWSLRRDRIAPGSVTEALRMADTAMDYFNSPAAADLDGAALR
jgi:hypothetical protein